LAGPRGALARRGWVDAPPGFFLVEVTMKPHRNGTATPAPLTKGGNGTAPDGRDPETGRFLPGWKGGPGNPHYRKVAALRRAIAEEISPEDLRSLIRSLHTRGLAGDNDAARLVLLWAAGKPADPVDADLPPELAPLLAALPPIARAAVLARLTNWEAAGFP